jgi:hypothetical protein
MFGRTEVNERNEEGIIFSEHACKPLLEERWKTMETFGWRIIERSFEVGEFQKRGIL